MFEVFISHEAEKFYKRQEAAIKKKINKSIEAISAEPFHGPHVKRLHGRLEGKYRYDVGGLRIIYDIEINN
jgi:mRNA interferase RelE/StbE